jgi:hypothetical protein
VNIFNRLSFSEGQGLPAADLEMILVNLYFLIKLTLRKKRRGNLVGKEKRCFGLSYKNTFITVSDDSNVKTALVPVPRNGKPTMASIEYELIKNNPYKYTQEDVQFISYLIRNKIDTSGQLDELREQFFAKPKACFRASPLVKKYGWGIHYDHDGKVALYEIESALYRQFLQSDDVKKLKGMRSKRA